MSSSQDKEFATFGIINSKLKAGLLIGLLSLSITGNMFLTIKLLTTQGDLYEKMLTRADEAARNQTNKVLAEPVKNMNRAAARVDTAVDVAIGSAVTANSAGMIIIKNQKKKEK